MNIQLQQADIVKAIQQYVSGQGILTTGKKVSVKFTATRKGGQNILADLVIEDIDATAAVAASAVSVTLAEDPVPAKVVKVTEKTAPKTIPAEEAPTTPVAETAVDNNLDGVADVTEVEGAAQTQEPEPEKATVNMANLFG